MIQNKDIIVVGIQPWDIEIGSNCKNIATELSKNNRVLYVNPPLDRITKLKENKKEKVKKRLSIQSGEKSDLEKINDQMWTLYPKSLIESINWVKSPAIYDFLNRRNAKKFAANILEAVEKLNFKNYLLFNDSSMFLGQHLKELLQPNFYIYYMRDFLTKNPYWKKQGIRLEPKLIATADLVVNNSTLYAEYGAQFNKHSYMVGQGCDTSLFNNETREISVAKDLLEIKKPIIGYVGFLSSRRLSIDIIHQLALQKPEWSIVLVGPEDENFKNSALHETKNVYFLGSREPEELPNYIQGFDVAINPQLVNDATIGNYPRKIDEYLVMGKPVLATATKAMEYFQEYTYLGKTSEDYIRLADQALTEDSSDKQNERRKYGTGHSWENNVNAILNYTEIVAKEKNIKL